MTESNRKAKPKAKRALRAIKPRKAAIVATSSPDRGVKNLVDWRGQTLARMRALILEAEPEMIEERKWKKPSSPAGVPVWSHNGIVCTGEMYKQVVKLTFAQGASLPDPAHLFNSSLEGNTRRAIDIHEGEEVDARAFKALVKAAVAHHGRPAKKAKPGARKVFGPEAQTRRAKPRKLQKNAQGVVLLSGGNPQIAKADGEAPVQAYIAAMPGWKSGLGKRLDALIARNVPNVRKAVRWNSPFYGVEGRGWFLGIHCLTKYVKVTFFAGTSLRPIPPGGTPKSKESRWIDIYEDDQLDEAQLAKWVKQAAALPGWVP